MNVIILMPFMMQGYRASVMHFWHSVYYIAVNVITLRHTTKYITDNLELKRDATGILTGLCFSGNKYLA